VRARSGEVKLGVFDSLDYGRVRPAILTLLALTVGFSFSMAVSRYDLRKNYEEAEANAIGTEYVRADLLPAEDVARVRDLIRKWLDQNICLLSAQRGAPDRRGGR